MSRVSSMLFPRVSALSPAHLSLYARCRRVVHTGLGNFSLTTLNIHAPIYKQLGDGSREAEHETMFLSRNRRILQMLLRRDCPIICLQEFWVADDRLTALYKSTLEQAGYTLHVTPRTGARGDGLCTAVANGRFEVLDCLPIPFKDVGDRVAHLLHLKTVGSAPGQEEVLLVNIHLMFPHDGHCTVIRLRQCAKMLRNLRVYTHARGTAEMPILICGDWNGTSTGHLAGFMRSQGFLNVYEECNPPAAGKWVSHLNHLAEVVGVDCIWLLNPSAQRGSLTADWRPPACASLLLKLLKKDCRTQDAAFAFFDREGRGHLTYEDFDDGVQRLGLTGQHSIGLLPHEVAELAEHCDFDGDGRISPADFLHVLDMEQGLHLLEQFGGCPSSFIHAFAATTCPMPTSTRHPHDLVIESSYLPGPFSQGIWPKGYEHEISDHAPLSASLRFPPRYQHSVFQPEVPVQVAAHVQ